MKAIISAVAGLVGFLPAATGGAAPGPTVAGTIRPPEKVTLVQALDRKGKKTHQARFDARTGRFEFARLPPGRYDLIIETTMGRIEGIDMRYHEGEFEELLRKKRGQEAPHEFDDDDFQQIIEHIQGIEQYEDVVRPLWAAEFGDRATVLVEKVRTRPFYNQKGNEYTWRTELWYYKYEAGGWAKASNVAVPLNRQRQSVPEFNKVNWVYDPSLGGIEVGQDGGPAEIAYRLPDKLDPRRGRVGGQIPKFKPDDVRPQQLTATRPATQAATVPAGEQP